MSSTDVDPSFAGGGLRLGPSCCYLWGQARARAEAERAKEAAELAREAAERAKEDAVGELARVKQEEKERTFAYLEQMSQAMYKGVLRLCKELVPEADLSSITYFKAANAMVEEGSAEGEAEEGASEEGAPKEGLEEARVMSEPEAAVEVAREPEETGDV